MSAANLRNHFHFDFDQNSLAITLTQKQIQSRDARPQQNVWGAGVNPILV